MIINPIETRKKQYGIVLVYGSILDPAGGSVVQNTETVVSNKPVYETQRINTDKTFALSR